ncbi:11622_t:CDS:2, partial [Scutellospora calospora]
WGFGYQVFCNDKDQNDSNITRRKSYRCSSSGTYEARKVIDQNLHCLRGTTKTSCEWHCNFSFPKTTQQIKCTTLKDMHNHPVNPVQISDVIARYRRFNNEMIQDIEFFLDCKVAPITQLEILKKKHPHHVFHKQDIYNIIHKLRQNDDERSDSVSLLDSLFEKMSSDPCWKVFIRHSGNERRLSDNYGRFRNVANALVEDELSSTYVWILQYLLKATNNVVPKSFWTDSEPGLISAVSQVFPNTHHFYCLFHILQNIIKHLKVSLGSNFNEFKKVFFSCRNALSVEIFEQRWEFIIKTFPECEHYMIKKLFANRNSWAKAYAPLQFNAGIQSTQSVESFNGRLEHSIPEDLCLDVINDNFIEDIVDELQATLKAILDNTNTSKIIEIWRIRRVGGLSNKDNL